jgi:hypothetical protein
MPRMATAFGHLIRINGRTARSKSRPSSDMSAPTVLLKIVESVHPWDIDAQCFGVDAPEASRRPLLQREQRSTGHRDA